MADHNVFAFTGPTPQGGYYPEYVSVNDRGGNLELSVRLANAEYASTIALTEQQVRDLQRALFAWLPGTTIVDAGAAA
jgi:hypothetical protein